MDAIKVRRKIDGDTLHIPELNSLIGQEVEVIVRTTSPQRIEEIDSDEFWKGKTIDQLAAEQGVGPLETLKSPVSGNFTAEDFEGFDEALEEWRREK